MSNETSPADETAESAEQAVSTETTDAPEASKFADAANQQSVGIVREFWDFLIHNKKWWLLPIILVLLLVAALVVLGTGPAAPFIYTLF